MCSVFSAFTSKPISLLATAKASAFPSPESQVKVVDFCEM